MNERRIENHNSLKKLRKIFISFFGVSRNVKLFSKTSSQVFMNRTYIPIPHKKDKENYLYGLLSQKLTHSSKRIVELEFSIDLNYILFNTSVLINIMYFCIQEKRSILNSVDHISHSFDKRPTFRIPLLQQPVPVDSLQCQSNRSQNGTRNLVNSTH